MFLRRNIVVNNGKDLSSIDEKLCAESLIVLLKKVKKETRKYINKTKNVHCSACSVCMWHECVACDLYHKHTNTNAIYFIQK
jgi:hypothetical protein